MKQNKIKLLFESWRKFMNESAVDDPWGYQSAPELMPRSKKLPKPVGEFTQEPSYLLFHFPSKKLHWVNTSTEYAFMTPRTDKLPPGQIMKSWTATSGRFAGPDGLNYSVDQVLEEVPESLQKKIKTMHMTGPLPGGVYTTRDPQDMPAHYRKPFFDILNSIWHHKLKGRKIGKWPGGRKTWGTWRVWLMPSGADVGKRKNFSIHGGKEWGSAGCIDLTHQIGDFKRYYMSYTSKYNVPMLLYSEYSEIPKNVR